MVHAVNLARCKLAFPRSETENPLVYHYEDESSCRRHSVL
jgi:hypothetical protein